MLYYILPTSLLFNVSFSANYSLCGFQGALVGSSGLEPPTSRLSGVRSNHLSYAPSYLMQALLASAITFSFFQKLTLGFQMALRFSLMLMLLFRSDGGDEEDRTPDPLLAKQVLSQLSYTPIQGIRFHLMTFSSFLLSERQLGT